MEPGALRAKLRPWFTASSGRPARGLGYRYRVITLVLDYARSHSAAGRLLTRILDIEFDVAKFRVGWGEVTAEEALGLRVLADERDKYQREKAKKDRQT